MRHSQVVNQFDVSSRTRPELLREQNTLLLELLLDNADSGVDKEMAVAEELQAKFVRIGSCCLNPTKQLTRGSISCASKQNARKVNLSKLEFIKFDKYRLGSRFGSNSRKITKMKYH